MTIRAGDKLSLVPDVLYTYQCPESEYQSLKHFVKTVDWSVVRRRGDQHNAGRSYIPQSGSLHNLETLEDVHCWVAACCNDAKKQVGWRLETVPDLAISQSWLNRSDTGEKHHRHRHPLSILSAIMYLSEPAETEFIAPSIYALPFILAPDGKTQSISNVTFFKAKERTLVVFPSSLKHGVAPNLEVGSRYTFSANTWIKGAHGISHELAFIPESLH